jgi:histidine triad (HIT) family protein
MHTTTDPNCPLCKVISGEYPSKKVYEDDKIFCALDINPATKGHIILIPKNHYPIMPVIPPDDFKHIARGAYKISESLKRAMVTSKTTIFIANGGIAGQQSSHFLIHIIPSEKMHAFDIKKNIDPDTNIYDALKKNLNIMMNNHSKRENKDLIGQETELMFENEHLKAMIPKNTMVNGHIELSAKSNINMSQFEDFFYLASYGATAAFEYLGAQGSNIMVNHTDLGFDAHIVPRFSGDGLNFMWTPNKFSDPEMDNIKNAISFETTGINLKPMNTNKPKVTKFSELKSLDDIKITENKTSFISKILQK